jgi:hypothetical protein
MILSVSTSSALALTQEQLFFVRTCVLEICRGGTLEGDHSTFKLSVCPEMIFRLRKPFGNKDANSDCLTGRKTSLFSNFFGNLGNNSLWL